MKHLCLCCLLLLSYASTLSIAAPEVDMTYAAEYDYVPVSDQLLSVVVSVVAPRSIGSAERSPLSVSAVLDRSGSMQGRKIQLLKRSTEFLVDQFQRGDYFGVVSYSSSASVDIPLTAVTSTNKGGFDESIDSIVASGSTNLADGLFQGLDQQVQADVSRSLVKSVILFTDGLANTGVTNIGSITSTMAGKLNGNRPPTVYALGFGGDHDARFLQAIAEAGNGAYVFVKDANAIASAIGEILGGLLTTVAQDIKLTFTPKNGVQIVNVRGGQVSSNMRMTTFPDLFAEERRDVLVDMKLPILRNALEKQEILEVKLEYFNTISNTRRTKTIVIAIDRKLSILEADSAPLVEKTRLRFQVADDIKTALEQKQAGNTKAATATLDGTLNTLNASSQSNSPEVKALNSDVKDTKKEVSQAGTLNTAQTNRLQAGASNVASQRAAGSESIGFASTRATSAQASSAQDASAFVSGR